MADITTLRRRRGIQGGQITKLKTKVNQWVFNGGLRAIDLLSIEQAKARLHMLDVEFKRYHVEVIDALDNDEEVERKQMSWRNTKTKWLI